MEPILSNGMWQAAQKSSDSFTAFNPSNKEALTENVFPVSDWAEIETLIENGKKAARVLALEPVSAIADFLEDYAKRIEDNTDRLADIAHLETGYPVTPRLAGVEIPRTVNQIRQAVAAARTGDWAKPTIDTANNIRSIHGPLGGPVVVFGPNNFPFAFNGISGGDFAAAIAAGNPVIAKAHPAHPRTTQLLGELALEALEASDLPAATVQLFYHTTPESGLKLVSHPAVSAVAFTGSRPGGLALKKAADEAGKPIYLEMSSVNPVFVLPGALAERGTEIATELHGSCTLGSGQFCTKPGIVVVQKDENSKALIEQMRDSFSNSAAGVLLTQSGLDAVSKAVDQLQAAGATVLAGGKVAGTKHYGFEPTLLEVSADTFLANPEKLQSEAFGPVCMIVVSAEQSQTTAVAEALEGNLTGCIYSDSKGTDEGGYEELVSVLRTKVGRLLNDKVPTGVAVSTAMNHGGPYPATGHPCFTAVGFPASIIRFSALHSYDNVRQDRLPTALQDKKATGSTFRLIDGAWTTADVS